MDKQSESSGQNDAMQSTEATTIDDLNDDVLRETFEYLDDEGLYAVADVCSSFKRNAQAEFAKRFKSREYIISIPANGFQSYCQAQRGILRNFGAFIHYLTVDTYYCVEEFREILELIIRNNGPPLKSLNLSGVDFEGNICRKLQPLLSQLQVLRLSGCTFETKSVGTEIISFCSKLRKLIATGPSASVFGFILEGRAIPTLESIRIEYIGNRSIADFLELNPQLKKISLLSCPRVTDDMIPSIVQYNPRIEKFELHSSLLTRDFIENTKRLARLPALKCLKINCGGKSFAPAIEELVAAHIPLERLILGQCILDTQFADAIVELKQLKILKIALCDRNMKKADVLKIARNLSELHHLDTWDPCHGMTSSDLLEIIQCAPKLQSLDFHFTEESKLDIESYMKIMNVVAARNEKCPLQIRCPRSSFVDVPKDLQKANRGKLRLTFRSH